MICVIFTGTGSGFSGGTTVANLDPAFTDETPILFFWESSDHHGGGTDIFISDAVGPEFIPEPGTMVLLFVGGVGMLIRRKSV